MRGLVPLFLECVEWASWMAHGWLGSDAPASLKPCYVPGKFLFIILPMFCSYVHLVKLFGVLFHQQTFLSQIM